MKSKSVKSNYEIYADMYDAFKGDRSEDIRLLRSLVRQHHADAHSLLDLACGTGAIAEGLGDSFEVVGLDNSPRMLQIARKKMPAMQFVQADMTNFALHRTFDVVFCLHNSMNHLITFENWQKTFDAVAAHLKPGGLFIFDNNPPEKMDRHTREGIGATQVGDNYILTQVEKDPARREGYLWHMRFMLRQKQNLFAMHHEVVAVSTYPLEQMRQALDTNFTITECFVLDDAESHGDIGREYFVCIKK